MKERTEKLLLLGFGWRRILGFDELFRLVPVGAGFVAPGAPLTDEQRLFGGLLIGQAIVAASSLTRQCHALHAFFVGVGVMQAPFDIAVQRIRDGGSFATRQVDIRQGERLLLSALTSHHDGDDGPQHQSVMPDLPTPEGLLQQTIIRARHAEAQGTTGKHYLPDELLDARPIELPPTEPGSEQPARAVWFRPHAPFADRPELHRAVIGFASDMGLVHVGLLNHRRTGGGPLQAASLDHSIWFHRDASAADWMLLVQRAPNAAHGRGLSRAQVFSRDGTLVASVAQEFLARTQRSPAEVRAGPVG